MDQETRVPPFRVNISATFTAEPLEPVFAFWSRVLSVDFDLRFAPYNQAAQMLLDPAGAFAANTHGVNIVLARCTGERAEETAAQLVEAARIAAARDASPLIFCLCPAAEPAPRAEDLMRRELSAGSRVRLLDYARIDELYPVEMRFDPAAERLGSVPYTETYFTALGTALVRQIASLSLLPYKVVAVDCDNTLWEGICGEDGPSGIRLDAPRRALQEFLRAQRDSGMVLCLASKNNPEDVIETFAQHPEMPLRFEDFAAVRLNWEPKPGNLGSIAEELGLALDSFIFIDDSPKECAEVQEGAPEVLTLALPEDLGRTSHFLSHVWAFDHPVVTEEDRKRAASYAHSAEFGRAFQSAHSLEDFMAALDLRVTIQRAAPHQYARLAQLSQRTNQFNFTGIRRTEAALAALVESKELECLTVEVSDRFGDYGLVGAMLFSRTTEELLIDSFLLSCRALGRGVEHRMLAYLANLGAPVIIAPLTPSSRNQPARDFLGSIGKPSDGVYRFTADSLRDLRWKPAVSVAPPKPATKSVGAQHRFVPFAHIAKNLSTPQEIVAAMRLPAEAPTEAFTPTERVLARIWSDLLKIPRVQPDDRFFDLGGHSLLAVLLISRVRSEFGVELPIDDVYSGDLTLRHLAARIEALQSGATGADDYESLLAEIEALSDDEVRALLAQEDPESLRF